MKITFACPYCGKKLSASETSAGQEKTCPNCRGRVTVPTAEAAAAGRQIGEAKPENCRLIIPCSSCRGDRSTKT